MLLPPAMISIRRTAITNIKYVDGDSDSPFTVTGDGIIATYFKLNSAYRANSASGSE